MIGDPSKVVWCGCGFLCNSTKEKAIQSSAGVFIFLWPVYTQYWFWCLWNSRAQPFSNHSSSHYDLFTSHQPLQHSLSSCQAIQVLHHATITEKCYNWATCFFGDHFGDPETLIERGVLLHAGVAEWGIPNSSRGFLFLKSNFFCWWVFCVVLLRFHVSVYFVNIFWFTEQLRVLELMLLLLPLHVSSQSLFVLFCFVFFCFVLCFLFLATCGLAATDPGINQDNIRKWHLPLL